MIPYEMKDRYTIADLAEIVALLRSKDGCPAQLRQIPQKKSSKTGMKSRKKPSIRQPVPRHWRLLPKRCRH